MKKTTTRYYCDICDKDVDTQHTLDREIQAVFHTEQNEGRTTKPYLSMVKIDICENCLGAILKDGKVLNASGAMGYNKYWFNEEKISTSDTEHLKWIYGRLIRYGENERVDYMVRLKKIIDKYEEE